MTEAADRQRSSVYAAESQVIRIIDRRVEFPTVQLFGSELVVPDDRKFGDLAAAQRYADAVLALNWVRSRWPGLAPVTVRARADAQRAHYEPETATIALPPFERGGRWALRELVVLHELAHHVSAASPAHGPEFVAAVLVLVDGLVGAEAEFLLRTTYLENGVRIG